MVYWSNRDIRQMRKLTYREHNYKVESREFLVAPGEIRNYTLRSSRESKFARLCELLVRTESVLKWWYEPHRFKIGTKYRKERVYTPDFLLALGDDDVFDTNTRSVWVEVKSSLTQADVSRLRWFHQAWPNLPICLMVDKRYDCHSKTGKRQRALQSSAEKWVNRILIGKEWYK